MSFVWIAIGGGLGSAFRYGAIELLGRTQWATFAVNTLGSFLVTFLAVYFARKSDNTALHLLLTTGFCGGFTTYSTFNNELLSHLQKSEWGPALLYGGLTLGACLAFGFLGYGVSTKIWPA